MGCTGQPDVLERIEDSDDLYICAYPSFNVNEMLAVARLYEMSAAASGKPIIVFNGAAHSANSGSCSTNQATWRESISCDCQTSSPIVQYEG